MTSSNSTALGAAELKRYFIFLGIALVPVLGAAIYAAGAGILLAVVVASICSAACEAVFSYVRIKQVKVGPGVILCGVVMPLMIPAATPLWMVGLGAIFGTIFAKEVFGGSGSNIFHPALAAKIFLLVSWPTSIVMAELLKAGQEGASEGAEAAHGAAEAAHGAEGAAHGAAEAAHGAAEAAGEAAKAVIEKPPIPMPEIKELLGVVSEAAVGEMLAVAVIVGGIILLASRVANWKIVIGSLVGVGVTAAIYNAVDPSAFEPPLIALLSGSVLFGVLLVATDPVTSPRTTAGSILAGLLIGIVAVSIKSLSNYKYYTESIVFAVMVGNLFAPAIDSAVVAVTGGADDEAAPAAEQGAAQ